MPGPGIQRGLRHGGGGGAASPPLGMVIYSSRKFLFFLEFFCTKIAKYIILSIFGKKIIKGTIELTKGQIRSVGCPEGVCPPTGSRGTLGSLPPDLAALES